MTCDLTLEAVLLVLLFVSGFAVIVTSAMVIWRAVRDRPR